MLPAIDPAVYRTAIGVSLLTNIDPCLLAWACCHKSVYLGSKGVVEMLRSDVPVDLSPRLQVKIYDYMQKVRQIGVTV